MLAVIVDLDRIDQKRIYLEALVEELDRVFQVSHWNDHILYDVLVDELVAHPFSHGLFEKRDLGRPEPAKAPTPGGMTRKRHQLFELPEN